MCAIFEQVLVQSILDRVRPERAQRWLFYGGVGSDSHVILGGTSARLGRQRTQVRCCFVYNKAIVWRDGDTRGSHVQVASVRSGYASFPSRTTVVFGVFPPRRPLPHLGERGARCKRLSRLGLAGHVPGTGGKVDSIHPTTVGPARSLEPPLATRNVGQCHRHRAPLLSSTGWSTPLTTSRGRGLYVRYVSLYVPMYAQPCTVLNHPHGNTVPSSATKTETRSTRTRRGFLPDGHAGGSACGRITDDAQSLRRAPTHTP